MVERYTQHHFSAQESQCILLLCIGTLVLGKKVGIIGLGGLGHMGVKIAHALGAEVSVLSHSLKKREDGIGMGADNFYATSDHETFKKLSGYSDLIIHTLAIEIEWDDYLGLLGLDGTMVVVGIPEKQTPINPSTLIMARRNLAGCGERILC
jgi:uncharacterized zinc-type alcohol dehydrogenase-like protein